VKQLFFVLTLAVSLSCLGQNLADGLRFYAPFDGDCAPAFAKGAKLVTVADSAFEPGKHGQAARLGSGISYGHEANLNPAVGTVAFWHRPDWNPLDKSDGNRILFKCVHVAANYQPGPRRFFFMTGRTLPQKGFKWDYGSYWNGMRDWQPGIWQHVAFSWNRETGEKKLYFNGKLVRQNQTSLIPVEFASGSKIQLGENAPGLYDELFIWDRVLPEASVTLLVKDPAKAAAQAAPTAGANANESSDTTSDFDIQSDKLAFYLPLNGSAIPLKAGGSKSVRPAGGLAFAPGIVDQSIRLTGQRLDYDSSDSLDITGGTLAFWLKPERPFSQSKTDITLFRAGHFALVVQPAKKKLYFMTGLHNGEYFRWDYSPQTSAIMNWKAGKWHHLAVVWDKSSARKELYLDGKLVQTHTSSRMPSQISPRGEMFLGENFHGEFDELLYFSSPLAAWRIAALCARPGLIALAEGLQPTRIVDNMETQQQAAKTLKEAASASSLAFDIVPLPPLKTVIAPGETFSVAIPARNPSIKVYDGQVRFTLRDFWLRDCGHQNVALKLAPGESKSLTVSFAPKLKGIYKIEARYKLAGQEKLRDLSSFACYPAPPQRDPESFFGNHINGWSNGKYLAQGARLGQTWQRNHNMIQTTWWFKVQPDPGEFTWTYDFQLKSLKQYQMPLLGQLFTTPYWAAYPTPQPKPAKEGYSKCWNPNLKHFEEYVYRTVARYKDSIKYWEVWNEPAVGMFWKSTPEDFAKMVQTAVKAAKRADPTCVVMAAGYTCPAWAWHQQAAQAGAFKGLDAISFHYGCPIDPPVKSETKLKAIVDHFQEMAVKYGDGKPLPMWSTEGSCGDTTFLRGLDYPQLPPESERVPMNWRQGAIRTVQGEAILMSQNVLKHFIYLQNGVSPSSAKVYQNTSMLDVTAAPRPKLMARVIMQDQLDWTEFKAKVFRKPGRFWANIHQKKTAKGSVVLMWCGDEGRLKLACDWPGKLERAINLMGNQISVDPANIAITDEPVYLHIDAPAEAVAAALRKAALELVKAPLVVEMHDGPDQPKVPVLPDYVAPGEKPSANFTVDLRAVCTMGFADPVAGDQQGGWSDEGPFNDLRDFKTGKRSFYGVDFDILDPAANHGKSILTMFGNSITPKMPKSVTIPLNRKVRTLYFLHAAAWGAPGDIAEYVLHYADGTTQSMTVNIPKHCNNWWNSFDPKEESRPVPVQVTNTSTGKPAWRYLRVFEVESFKNDVPVKSIELISAGGSQTPIIVAISGTSW
jgi:hypothetical protein